MLDAADPDSSWDRLPASVVLLRELKHPVCFLAASISCASNYLFSIAPLCKVFFVVVVAVLRQSTGSQVSLKLT